MKGLCVKRCETQSNHAIHNKAASSGRFAVHVACHHGVDGYQEGDREGRGHKAHHLLVPAGTTFTGSGLHKSMVRANSSIEIVNVMIITNSKLP